MGDGDVTVTGRDGYSQAASLVSKAANADGSLTAVYRVPGPGGTWDAATTVRTRFSCSRTR